MNIVITGASKGFGKAIAEKFAASGYSLFLCARHEEPLATLANSLEQRNPSIKAKFLACDVSRKNEVRKFADWILEHTSAPDVIINNAGSFEPGQIHGEEDGVLEKLMETNLYSAYYLSRHLLPGMMKARKGHIFNLCSIASLHAYNNGGSYSITKYALAGFSANLRHEMKGHGIKVTSVFPGAAYTDSWSRSGVSPDRIMTAEDIAEIIYCSSQLSPQACVEEIVIRPQLGDL